MCPIVPMWFIKFSTVSNVPMWFNLTVGTPSFIISLLPNKLQLC